MSRRLHQWLMACVAVLLMGGYATPTHATIVQGDPNVNVNGTIIVSGGILSNAEHRLSGTLSNIRFLPNSVGLGWNYLQLGTSSADTGANLRIARWGTATGSLSSMEIYTGLLNVFGTPFAEIRLTGPTSGYRLLGDVSGINYFQVGASSLDTNAKFSITRFGTSSTNIANLNFYADTTYLSGNVGIGTATPTVKLDVNGEAAVNVLNIRGGADISKKFDIRGDVKPGYVVSIDPGKAGSLMISATPYDRKVAGIVSGAGGVTPGLSLGQPNTLATGKYAVAITGRVYCYADASAGAIEPGDLLTTSAIPGHAMKAANSDQARGAVIGKAMTGLTSGQDLILVLVNLQ